MSLTDITMVTGFPSFTARRMIEKVLASEPEGRVYMLVSNDRAADAEEMLRAQPREMSRRLTVLIGDVTSMDLGLSSREYRAMISDLTSIHHMAARYHLGASKEQVQQLNVGGTRGVLELALECQKLRRFNFWSTVHVSGDREGVIMEDELDSGQHFRNEYEHSKYAAEKIVRTMSRRVPSTVLRPGIIVGDSKSGEIDRYDGPYHLMSVLMNSPFDLQLPLPGRGVGPFNLVPVDYVINAGYMLGRHPRAISRTFHLVDPAPLSGRSVYELVADRARRPVPKAVIPGGVAKALLKLPWVGRLKGSPRTIMEGFNQQVWYNARNTLELLRGSDVWCPSFDSYVDGLVRYVKDVQMARRRGDDDIADPLD
ncbi:MAG: SDR family oxidoreductase [Myxococcales bacterium]|nr:SDR family oxidoreductase [Myxococcales bacterium]